MSFFKPYISISLLVLFLNVTIQAGTSDLSSWISNHSDNPIPGLTSQLAPFASPVTGLSLGMDSRKINFGSRFVMDYEIQAPLIFSSVTISPNLLLGLNCGGGKWRDDNLMFFGPVIITPFGSENSPWSAMFSFTNLFGPDDFHIISNLLGISKTFYIRRMYLNVGLSRIQFQWRIHADDLSDDTIDGHFSEKNIKYRFELSLYYKIYERFTLGTEAGITNEIPTLSFVIMGDI